MIQTVRQGFNKMEDKLVVKVLIDWLIDGLATALLVFHLGMCTDNTNPVVIYNTPKVCQNVFCICKQNAVRFLQGWLDMFPPDRSAILPQCKMCQRQSLYLHHFVFG